MNQAWFEMRQIRSRLLSTAVWIPLRAIETVEELGEVGYEHYKENFFALGSVLIPLQQRESAAGIGWQDIGTNHSHSPSFDENGYRQADQFYDDRSKVSGVFLVLETVGNTGTERVWHLHQDPVIALGLLREDDLWVCPDRGYESVARLSRAPDGLPVRLEMRAQYLKDYLCARQMIVRTSCYRSRTEISASREHIAWTENPTSEIGQDSRWEGRVTEIHEGGMAYGTEISVLRISREGLDSEVDVPKFEMDEGIVSESWKRESSGRKLYRIQGELWREEWLEPADVSPIVCGEAQPSSISFAVAGDGTRECSDTLQRASRWLWFKPEVAEALLQQRGGTLNWYSRYTGSLGRLPGYTVHFGVNSVGLINVFAKDVALLPEWQQQLWVAHNVTPEGGVSAELMTVQMGGDPANTKAPEGFMHTGMDALNKRSREKFGFELLEPHAYVTTLLPRVHRFRSCDVNGLRALSKDVTRLLTERINRSEIFKRVPPKGEDWGTLKALEELLATTIGKQKARQILSPLEGARLLRLGDAHLPGSNFDYALELAQIDPSVNFIEQGYQLLDSCIGTISLVWEALQDI